MTPTETFIAWRAEMAADLADHETQLTAARTALEAAETAQRAAKAAWIVLTGFASGLETYNPADGTSRPEALCGPLLARLNQAHEPVTAAAAVSARARGDLAALLTKVTGLRDALAQMDRLLTNSKVAVITTPVVTPRRPTPAIVDFDDITMPSRQGAAP